jgi:uncharacterized protein with GYD domain
MASYIVLGKWTDQGIRNIKDSPQRLDMARRSVEAAGGKMPSFYLVFGQYDFVAIIEAPNDEAYARVMLTLGSAGNVSTTTLKALTEEEYRRVVGSLS